jgi:hypothetical protein
VRVALGLGRLLHRRRPPCAAGASALRSLQAARLQLAAPASA